MSKAIPGRPNRPLVVKCGYEGSFRRVNFPSAQTCRLESIRLRVSSWAHTRSLEPQQSRRWACSLMSHSRWKSAFIYLRRPSLWLIPTTTAKNSPFDPKLISRKPSRTLYQATTHTLSSLRMGPAGASPSLRKRSRSSSMSWSNTMARVSVIPARSLLSTVGLALVQAREVARAGKDGVGIASGAKTRD